MNFQTETVCTEPKLRVDNYLPRIGKQAVTREILAGLCSEQKHISSMFFYDAAGSKLFEEITRLPEYYLTRTEMSLIEEAARQINGQLYNMDIIEIGSGDCSKISILLGMIPEEAINSIRYIPVDVSQAAIEESADILSSNFNNITIHGIVADFITQLNMIPGGSKRLFCFFGSTIGNFSREQAARFFTHVSTAMQPGDQLLLGMDRVKDIQVLEKAYNDSQAVTATFNRNILKVINNLVNTDFDPDAFEHVAFYNEANDRIEMYLKARKDMEISCPHLKEALVIRQDETIHTENSHKFTDTHIKDLEKTSGLKIQNVLTDRKKWFSLVHFTKQTKAHYA